MGKEMKAGKIKKILFIVFIFAIISTLSFFIYSKKLVPFQNALYWYTTDSVTIEIQEDELEKLEYFPNLKYADLRKSTCYKQIVEFAKKHPNIDVLYTVPLPEDIVFDESSKHLDFSRLNEKETLSAIDDYLVYMPNVRSVSLNLDNWSIDNLNEFHEKYKTVTVDGTFQIGDLSIPLDITDIDVSKLNAEELDMFFELAPYLENLNHIDFGKEDGHSLLPTVSAFDKAHNNINVDYTFTAFGKEIDYHASSLDFNHIEMSDQGKEVRNLLDNMPSVTYLDMDFCGVDDKHMAKIRDDYPNIEVVWRIWFGTNYSVRTDVEKILASAPNLGGELTPENTQSLNYCTKVKYLDIGHNNYLRDISFVKNMPDLEVLIVMMGNITDISPIASCKHMEFLEIFTNQITDLSPLSNLKELKHLNICYNGALSDLSPVYNLTQLERLWIGSTTSITYDQVQHFQQLAPNCLVNFTCVDPHDGWRWGTERYALLQKQLGYLEYDYQIPENDPLYYPHE